MHTPGPWTIHDDPGHTSANGDVDHGGYRIDAHNTEQLAFVWRSNHRWGDDPQPFGATEAEANARLIAAAPGLLEAAQLLEAAETHHANCEECEGEGVPELCPVCFPLFDEARVKRRLAIRKAEKT